MKHGLRVTLWYLEIIHPWKGFQDHDKNIDNYFELLYYETQTCEVLLVLWLNGALKLFSDTMVNSAPLSKNAVSAFYI